MPEGGLRRAWAAALFLAGMLGLGLLSLMQTRGRPALPPGGDFTLQGPQGPVALQQFRGRVVLVFFGYLGCPDVCPRVLGAQGAALRLLTPAERTQVAGLFISLDPERDAPAEVQACAQTFHPLIQGLTGPRSEVEAVALRYGVTVRRTAADSRGNYAVDHTSDTCLIAPSGRLLERLPADTPPEALAAEIRSVLAGVKH